MQAFGPIRLACLKAALFVILAALQALAAHAQELDSLSAKSYVEPPYKLGSSVGIGTWELINLDGRVAGYGFETLPLVPLPGFSGAPINLFVSVTIEGQFINAEIISHNEPIFVSGLDGTLFHKFVSQYKGYSILDRLVVGVPYGKKGVGSSLIYLDGVTKATASVRIAHETILGAAFTIAREKLGIEGSTQKVRPNLDYAQELTWDELVEQGIAKRKIVTNAQVEAAFEGSLWEDDDIIARENPEKTYIDLWVIDVGPPSIAKAVLSEASVNNLREFQVVSRNDEPLLLIDAGRHGLVASSFVRNTSSDLIFLMQGGLPISLRDSDLEIELAEGVPGNIAMIFRTDRRLGFDPTSKYELAIRAVREHGTFRPEIGIRDFFITHKTDRKFYNIEEKIEPLVPWKQAALQRLPDLTLVAIGLLLLVGVLIFRMDWLAGLAIYTPVRLSILAVVVGFVGWWGQGQLSMATVLGVGRSVVEGRSLSFLFYDPFSLIIWAVVALSFFVWGRGLFCGWLCPFGAMQEFAHHLGRVLKLPQFDVPESVDAVLLKTKYVILTVMIGAIFVAPDINDQLIEIEPFKTAITTLFVREWYYVAYAGGLLLSAMVLFKGFCRYICPLGAFLAIGGLLRMKDWIARRKECGSPCQLCNVKCNYNAIKKTGAINYSECFQCLDCVTIYDDEKTMRSLGFSGKG